MNPMKITKEEFDTAAAKEIAYFNEKTSLKTQITAHIFKNYPAVKQASDTADKMYYETVLKAGGFENLEAAIMELLMRANSANETLSDLVKGYDDDIAFSLSRLVKVANRVSWTQNCKKAYFNAKTSGKDLVLIPFPKSL